MKFENTPIDIQKINGVTMFGLYSVGMALGYAKTAKGKVYPFKNRIDKVAENAEISAVVHGVQPYITESQLYDFMLEARTDKCRAFRKWLTNEVLPQLNHTGTYTMPKKEKQLSLYSYFDKTYKGEAILSVADVEYFTGLDRYRIRKAMKLGTEFMDYYFLKGKNLASFKGENNNRSSNISEMFIITKSGFELICKTYGIKIETPKLFIEEKLSETKTKTNTVLSADEREKIIDSIIGTFEQLVGMNKKKQWKHAPLIESKNNYDVVMFIQR